MDIKTTISSTEARKNFAKVLDHIDKASVQYTLTINGKPKVVIMSAEEYESWQETIEIMSDTKAMADIRAGLADLQAGRFSILDELKNELMADVAPANSK